MQQTTPNKSLCYSLNKIVSKLLSKINDEFIDNMRQYALEKTGYNIPLKIKPFDNKFELPDNYYEFNIPNDESDTEDIVNN